MVHACFEYASLVGQVDMHDSVLCTFISGQTGCVYFRKGVYLLQWPLSDGHAMTSTWCELHQSVYVDMHDSVLWYICIIIYTYIVLTLCT